MSILDLHFEVGSQKKKSYCEYKVQSYSRVQRSAGHLPHAGYWSRGTHKLRGWQEGSPQRIGGEGSKYRSPARELVLECATKPHRTHNAVGGGGRLPGNPGGRRG